MTRVHDVEVAGDERDAAGASSPRANIAQGVGLVQVDTDQLTLELVAPW